MGAAAWEEVKKKGEKPIRRWINKQLEGTSVTVVLIGAEISERKYIQYEISQSWDKGSGLIGVYIHKLKDPNERTDIKGADPFVKLGHKGIRTYGWVDDNGYENLGDWVEGAYQRAQKRT